MEFIGIALLGLGAAACAVAGFAMFFLRDDKRFGEWAFTVVLLLLTYLLGMGAATLHDSHEVTQRMAIQAGSGR